jgi:haloalkane dehalogenase
MLPFDRYRVDVGGAQMHVMESGRGFPVLMLHGNPTWGFLYRRVASALAGASVRAIMPDLLGLGLSDKPRDSSVHTLEYHAGAVAELVRRLALERLVLVVQDWGGAIGALAMEDQRDRLAGMVVLNTVIGPPRADFRPTGFHRFARLPVVSDIAFRLGFPQNVIVALQGDKRSIRGDVARAYRHPLRHVRDRVAPLALARMVPDSMDHPSIAPLQRCQRVFTEMRGPCEIVWGDRDPILGGVRTWMQKLKPDAPVTRTQAGHFLQEEVPGQIAAAIRRVTERAR